ncbi:cytochrome C [Blastopirellula marina]|uniref:Cytochrome C n=1 Tax=Blastopirellula marina TaxID=124 RepID=A0A2S8G3C7_9BACT|nr:MULTISPECIES: DUF1553 domain-containing protein [Pirellulaceae]PQO38790.1 cytochrome C [Blastopirellula marina]RCS55098.1 DUF1553 domain-containing protein [Bremerella cremea]
MLRSTPQSTRAVCLFLWFTLGGWTYAQEETLPQDFFEKSVAPILSSHCVTCHNDQKQEGGLSLSDRQSALNGGDSGESIVPRQTEASLLLEYVIGDPPEMPKGGQPLSNQEIAILRRWIAGGATWPKELKLEAEDRWWSRQSLSRPSVPEVPLASKSRVRTPIDAFILAQLHKQEMDLSPEADARTLVRRLYYDLIGLPPTPEEMRQWTSRLNQGEEGYQQLVEHLLASPHYGERWARHWLDVVKYADTCGYDKDKLRRNAWPYRDYVIRSLNDDKPYARFVEEQIAGDALFPGEQDGILGLGFIAAGPWDFIGHVEVPASKIDGKNARNLDRDEMVSNTLNTFCSVTIQCARCHDHKFDPYTQQHYYGLQAVFAAVDRAERPFDMDPQIEKKRLQLVGEKQAIEQQLASLQREMAADGGKRLTELRAQVQSLGQQAKPESTVPQHGYHSHIEKTGNQSKWVQIDLGNPTEISKIVLHPCYDDFAGIGPGFGFPLQFTIEAASDATFADSQKLSDETTQDYPNPLLASYEVEVPITARFVRITATKLAPRQNDFIFALSEVEVFDANDQNIALKSTVQSLDSIEAPVRWQRSNLVDGLWPKSISAKASEELNQAKQALAELEKQIETPERITQRAEFTKRIQDMDAQLKSLPSGKMVYAAATHFNPQGSFQPTQGTPRDVHVLHRGNVTEPRAKAMPGTLPLPGKNAYEFALPTDHDESERRAALAKWITSRDHPLTWRSIVNRLWYYHFDQAIVGSPNDFGRMGQMPTHPQLLDWLAVEFRDNDQSFKHLHRLIVTSSVYRQSSQHNEVHAAKDSSNRFLWRMNRRRLEAEEIRDSILSVSGKLDTSMGGPGFFVFKLEKEAHSPHYEYHKFDPSDPASHRRSIYRFIVRSQPDPYMTTLDCADSSQSTPKRSETLTALQALSMLNNPFQLTMAQSFAERLQHEAPTLPEQVELGVQLTLGREPTDFEREKFTAFAQENGVANLCRVFFNQSEFVYLD